MVNSIFSIYTKQLQAHTTATCAK